MIHAGVLTGFSEGSLCHHPGPRDDLRGGHATVLYRFAECLAESASDDEGDFFSDTRKTAGRRAGIRGIILFFQGT